MEKVFIQDIEELREVLSQLKTKKEYFA